MTQREELNDGTSQAQKTMFGVLHAWSGFPILATALIACLVFRVAEAEADPSGLQLCWAKEVGPGTRVSIHFDHGDHIVITRMADLLVAFLLGTGQELWRRSLPNLDGCPDPLSWHDQVAFVGDTAVSMLDLRDGHVIWEYPLTPTGRYELAMVGDTLLLQETRSPPLDQPYLGVLRAIDPRLGQELWQRLEVVYKSSLEQCVLSGRSILLPSLEGVRSVSSKTGGDEHVLKIRSGVDAVTPVSDGKVVLVTRRSIEVRTVPELELLLSLRKADRFRFDRVQINAPWILCETFTEAREREAVLARLDTGVEILRVPLAGVAWHCVLLDRDRILSLFSRSRSPRAAADAVAKSQSFGSGALSWERQIPAGKYPVRPADQAIIDLGTTLLCSVVSHDQDGTQLGVDLHILSKQDGRIIGGASADALCVASPQISVHGSYVVLKTGRTLRVYLLTDP